MARFDAEFTELLQGVDPDATRLQRIAAILRRYDHALIGAHARNAYAEEPRTTVDLDVLLPPDQADAFAAEVAAILPQGTVSRRPLFLVVRRGKKKILDIGFPGNHPLLERAFADARMCTVPAVGEVRVAPKEALIAMKSMSAVDERRRADKAKQDEADALALLLGKVDRAYLAELAALLPPEGRAKLEELEGLARKAVIEDDPTAPMPG